MKFLTEEIPSYAVKFDVEKMIHLARKEKSPSKSRSKQMKEFSK